MDTIAQAPRAVDWTLLACVIVMLGCGEPASLADRWPGVSVALPKAVAPSRAAERPKPAPSTAPCFDDDVSDDWLPRAASRDVGLDGPGIDRLIGEAIASRSDALVVIKDDKIIVERSFGQPQGPLETRSVTKSVASLAVLALVADGHIASLDVPLSTFFSEFEQGDKAAITLRHVLTHASGLTHAKTDADRLNAQSDRLAYARRLRVETPPGTRFSYSNEASQLLAGVIDRAAGEPFDSYVTRRILAPIGVHGVEWKHDRSGKVQTYYGLRLRARDMARIGLLLLHEGRHEGRRILPAELVRAAAASSATSLSYGLLFWRRSNLTQIEAEPAKLASRIFRTEGEYFQALGSTVGASERNRHITRHRSGDWVLRELTGGDIGFYAVGGLGQRLAIYPRASIVAVRQHRRRADSSEARVAWRGFFDAVEALDRTIAREVEATMR